MSVKPFRLSLAAAASLAGLTAASEAYAIDYDALEQLFGEPITTSATGAPQRVSEAPATMDILTAEDISRSGARNIPDLLATVTGLDVRRTSQGNVDVSIRGYNQAFSPRLLVLVNGRQVYLDHYGVTNWDLVPIEMSEIRQIEVVKGPGTALFGFNAVSGVINIITYTPLDDRDGTVLARVGTQNFREVSATETFKIGRNAGLRLSGGYYEADDFNDAERLKAVPWADPRRLSLAGDFLAQVNPDAQIGLKGTYVEVDRSALAPFYAPQADLGKTWSVRLHGNSDTPLGLVKAAAYHNYFESFVAVPGFSGRFGNRVTVAQLEDVFKAGASHTLRLAGEYRHNELFGDIGSVKLDIGAAAAMWSWSIAPQVTWTSAVRYDLMHISGRQVGAPFNVLVPNLPGLTRDVGETSFNTGVIYRATDKDTFRLEGGRGIQAPSLLELTGNPNIEPSILTSAEIGYDRRIETIGGGLRADLFVQSLQAVQAYGIPFSANIGDSKSLGAEIELRGAVRDWNWKFGYIYQNVADDLNNSPGPGGIYPWPHVFEKTTSDGIFVGQIGRKAGPLEFGVFVRGVSGTEQVESPFLGAYALNRVPGYVSTGARIAYTLSERVQIELTGQDLTNNAEQFANFRVEPRAYLTLRGKF